MKYHIEPCPFCGSGAFLYSRKGVKGIAAPSHYWRGRVICKNGQCQATLRQRNNPEQAVSDWNRRTDQNRREMERRASKEKAG